MQEEIIGECGCFHTKMDLSLLDEEKVPVEKRRPCSMTRNGNRESFLVVLKAKTVFPFRNRLYLFQERIRLLQKERKEL